METVIVNTATGNAILPTESVDRAFFDNVMNYRLAVSMAESMASKGIISWEECRKLRTIIANKFRLSSCSIFL